MGWLFLTSLCYYHILFTSASRNLKKIKGPEEGNIRVALYTVLFKSYIANWNIRELTKNWAGNSNIKTHGSKSYKNESEKPFKCPIAKMKKECDDKLINVFFAF